jgi:hypothetical protein
MKWDYTKVRTEADYVYWLRHNNVSKDRKWIYTLIAWCIEHRSEKVMKVNQHINTIWHHNQGYFEKYKDEKEAKKYHQEYYKDHADAIKKQSSGHEKCIRKVWKLYTTGKLSKECTDKISMELEVYSKRLKIRGRCR